MPRPQCLKDRLRFMNVRRMAVANTERDPRLRIIRYWDGRPLDEEDVCTMGLYKVTHGERSIHVFAENELGAMSQAECKFGFAHVAQLTAEKVPFLMRGCGGDEF